MRNWLLVCAHLDGWLIEIVVVCFLKGNRSSYSECAKYLVRTLKWTLAVWLAHVGIRLWRTICVDFWWKVGFCFHRSLVYLVQIWKWWSMAAVKVNCEMKLFHIRTVFVVTLESGRTVFFRQWRRRSKSVLRQTVTSLRCQRWACPHFSRRSIELVVVIFGQGTGLDRLD